MRHHLLLLLVLLGPGRAWCQYEPRPLKVIATANHATNWTGTLIFPGGTMTAAAATSTVYLAGAGGGEVTSNAVIEIVSATNQATLAVLHSLSNELQNAKLDKLMTNDAISAVVTGLHSLAFFNATGLLTGRTDHATGVLTNGSTAGNDLSGTLPAPQVAGIRGRTVTDAEPAVGSLLQWNGTLWVYVASNQVGQSTAVTNLPYVLEGFAAFPAAGSDAFPAGANGIEGVALVTTNSSVLWCFAAPERWTGTNWSLRGTIRFPQAGAATVTVHVQVVSFPSGSTNDPNWADAPVQALAWTSSGTASNRVMLPFAPSSLFTNVQPGHDVYVRARRANSGVAGWLKRLEVLNQ